WSGQREAVAPLDLERDAVEEDVPRELLAEGRCDQNRHASKLSSDLVPRIVALDVGSSSVRAVAYDGDGNAEPGDAHLAYGSYDADELVAACRSVLAHVGEGDVV